MDILSEDARRASRDELVEQYLTEAEQFLDFAYDDDPLLATSELRRDFARACLERSRSLGIARSREHLSYLAISVLCGYAFEANPLYQSELRRAGWSDDNDQLRRAPDPAAMMPFASRWQRIAAVEASEPARLLLACQDMLGLLESNPISTYELPRDMQVAVLREAWPDRTAIFPLRALEWFCDLLNRNIVQQQMPADVAVMFSVFSLHLGIYFFHDPRYRQLSQAFAQRHAAPAERSALVASAIRQLLTLEPLTEETSNG
ncbi:hypothetical protein [Paracoccus aminophilus]|uniref:Uncharacterized protein n=1 Tax=Paracoccus aminophilus JCM 7686 TaxID=1367847 RepID=S5Y7E6_PARAH|nr:hypothetical protein [Paracoccus aminophilus]AGT07258.1 hypothetical protein JCM7686_0147 [Paracoccus aminophilus JCM 7686]